MDLQPTNKQFRIDGMTVFCFRDDVIDRTVKDLILEPCIRQQIPNMKINLLKKKRIGIRRSGRRPNLRFHTSY